MVKLIDCITADVMLMIQCGLCGHDGGVNVEYTLGKDATKIAAKKLKDDGWGVRG